MQPVREGPNCGLAPDVRDHAKPEFVKWGMLRPFQRLLVYDEKLGRCKRRSEEEPLPALTAFGERGLPVPRVPLPGWKGPVPPLPAIFGEIFLPPLSPNRLKTETLDIDFPQEEK